MKSFSAVVVSVALACYAANASALQSGSSDRGQAVCEIKSDLHRNLASVLIDPTGVSTLNDAREGVRAMCKDPKAHNAIVDLLDVITDVATDPHVSQTLGNALYWARQVLKDRNFRVLWLEEMRGLNMLFERASAASKASDALFDLLERLLRSPYFDTSFERTVSTVGRALKARNDSKFLSLAYTLASKAKYSGGGNGRPAKSAASPNDKRKRAAELNRTRSV